MASLELKLIVDAESGIAKIKSFGEAVEGSAARQKSAWGEVKESLTALAELYVLDKGIEFLKSSVEEYGKAEKASAKLDAVLRSTRGAAGLSAQAMKDYAEQLQSTTAFEDDTIVNAEAMLATFTKINDPNLFKEAVTAALNLSTTMDGDLKGAVLQVGKALNDPSAGLKALRLSGISFTSAQIDLIKTLQDSGDLLGAQKVILAEVKNEMGGTAEAAGKTLAGQMERLKNETGNAKEALGGLLLNGLAPLIPKFTEAAQGAALFFDNLGKGREKTQTDRIGKEFEFVTKQLFSANEEVKRLKTLYGDSAESVGAYHDAVKRVQMLEKQRAADLKSYRGLVDEAAEAEKKAAKEREDRLKADKEIEMLAATAAERQKYAELAKKTIAEIGTAEDVLVQKYKLEYEQIKGTSKEAAEARYAVDRKLSQDLGQLWEKEAEKQAKEKEKEEKVLKDYADLAAKTLADVGTEEEKLVQKYQLAVSQIEGDSKEAADARYAVDRKLSQDLVDLWDKQQDKYRKMSTAQLLEIRQSNITTVEEKQHVTEELQRRDDNYLTSFKDNLAQAAGANKTMYDQMGEQGAAWGSAMKSTLTGVFEDGLKGNLKSAQDYVNVFKDAVIKAAAAMLAEWTAAYVAVAAKAWWTAGQQKAASMVGGGPSGGGSSPSGGNPPVVIPPVGGAAPAATGEIVPTATTAGADAYAAQTAGTTTAETTGSSTAGGFSGGAAIGWGLAAIIAYKAGQSFFDPEADMSPENKYRYGIPRSASAITDEYKKFINNRTATGPLDLDERNKLALMEKLYAGKKTSWQALKALYGAAITDAEPFPDFPTLTGTGVGPGGIGTKYQAFADGGIMTSRGALPLHAYDGGGIATSPQVALFGEGSVPEAYVPLPNGRSIPVEMNIPSAPRSGETTMPLVINIGAKKLEEIIVDLTWTLSEGGVLAIHPRAVRSYAQ